MARVSVAALQTLHVLKEVSVDLLAKLTAHASLQHLERNMCLIPAEGESPYVFGILSGRVKVTIQDRDGGEVILDLLGAGEVVGELGLLDPELRHAAVYCLTDVDVIQFERRHFQQLLQSNLAACWALAGCLAHRLRRADRQIERLALQDVEGRVVGVLHELSEPQGSYRVVSPRVSKQDLARMVGASREMVSRVMKRLGQRGVAGESNGRILLYRHGGARPVELSGRVSRN